VVPACCLAAFTFLYSRRAAGFFEMRYAPATIVGAPTTLVPSAWTPPPGYVDSVHLKREHIIKRPKRLELWATPRAALRGASHTLTGRSKNDLWTQVRFEKDTPDDERSVPMNPAWVEFLMGFPNNYTCGGVDAVFRRAATPAARTAVAARMVTHPHKGGGLSKRKMMSLAVQEWNKINSSKRQKRFDDKDL